MTSLFDKVMWLTGSGLWLLIALGVGLFTCFCLIPSIFAWMCLVGFNAYAKQAEKDKAKALGRLRATQADLQARQREMMDIHRLGVIAGRAEVTRERQGL